MRSCWKDAEVYTEFTSLLHLGCLTSHPAKITTFPLSKRHFTTGTFNTLESYEIYKVTEALGYPFQKWENPQL